MRKILIMTFLLFNMFVYGKNTFVIENSGDNEINLQKILEKYEEEEIDKEKLIEIISDLSRYYLESGSITTYVTLKGGNINEKRFVFEVKEGKVDNIVFETPGKIIGGERRIRGAFPNSTRGTLRIQDIDQGLENISAPQFANNVSIVSSPKEGYSNILLKETKYLTGFQLYYSSLTPYSLSGSITIPNILNLNDVLYIDTTIGNSLDFNYGITYKIPIGYHQLTFTHRYNRALEDIWSITGRYYTWYKNGFNTGVNYDYTVYRNGKSKITAGANFDITQNDSLLEKFEIGVQSGFKYKIGGNVSYTGITNDMEYGASTKIQYVINPNRASSEDESKFMKFLKNFELLAEGRFIMPYYSGRLGYEFVENNVKYLTGYNKQLSGDNIVYFKNVAQYNFKGIRPNANLDLIYSQNQGINLGIAVGVDFTYKYLTIGGRYGLPITNPIIDTVTSKEDRENKEKWEKIQENRRNNKGNKLEIYAQLKI